MTREFSICLVPDETIRGSVLRLRAELPTSPYRDDTPHITLLRGIVGPTEASDDELLLTLDALIKPGSALPTTFAVKKIANRSSHLYSASSLVILRASKPLKTYRKQIIHTLKQQGYIIPILDQCMYIPHLTIRLGVPLKGPSKETAAQLFPPSSDLVCSSWMILRLKSTEGAARTMHEIRPTH